MLCEQVLLVNKKKLGYCVKRRFAFALVLKRLIYLCMHTLHTVLYIGSFVTFCPCQYYNAQILILYILDLIGSVLGSQNGQTTIELIAISHNHVQHVSHCLWQIYMTTTYPNGVNFKQHTMCVLSYSTSFKIECSRKKINFYKTEK